MLDVNKTRSNYQKFSTISLKEAKCDAVISTAQHQQHQRQTSNKSSLTTKFQQQNAELCSNKATKTATTTTGNITKSNNSVLPQSTTNTRASAAEIAITTVNAVRAANKNFFLCQTLKDQNFLKAECEIAQAQIANNAKKLEQSKLKYKQLLEASVNRASSSIAAGNVKLPASANNSNSNNIGGNKRVGIEDKQNNNSNNISNNNHYNNIQQALSRSAAAVANGMRRSSAAGGGSGSSNSYTTAALSKHNGYHAYHNKVSLPTAASAKSTTLPTTASTAAATTSSAAANTKLHGGRAALKTSFTSSSSHHRTIPSTAIAAANAISTQKQSKANNNNNNISAYSNTNNNMQQNAYRTAAAGAASSSLDHDEIKYIDCDEVTGPTTIILSTSSLERKPNLSANVAAKAAAATTRVRPKSTIMFGSNAASSSAFVSEKINNYKYANGVACGTAIGVTSNNSTTSHMVDARLRDLRTSGIDANSIKKSIDKFNNLSEHQRQSASSGVTMRANRNSSSHRASAGSANNLQHRHSSDLDCFSVRVTPPPPPTKAAAVSNADACGSLRLSSYRATTSSAYNTTAAAMSHSSAAAVAAMAAANTNSLPSKSSASPTAAKSRIHVLPSLSCSREPYANKALLAKEAAQSPTASPTSTSIASKSSAAAAATCKKQDTTASPYGSARKQTAAGSACGLSGTNEDSVRSSLNTRSVLPPSPTSSRYWDRERDSIRNATSLLASSSYNNHSDDVIKAATDEKTEAEKRRAKKLQELMKDKKPFQIGEMSRSQGLCGLKNIGNTCFMNSVIQCLSHTTELTKFLRTYNGQRSTSTKDQLILQEFAKLIREMWTNNVRSVTPMELKRAFSTKHRMYSDYNQQDAQEFLRFFLDSLHSALNTGVKGEVLKIDDNLSDNKKADLTWEWYSRYEDSLIRDLFVGQLKSTLRCTTCGNTSVTFDPFWDLSVPLPSSSRCKLDACLDLFIREEVLDGDEMPTCSRCKTRRKCTKRFTIQRFPKYLVIHLKRFSETRWSKLSNIVEFPTGERELNMAPYGSNNTNIHYSLYAISNHMGSTAGGHYVALCKHPVSQKWHEFNDNVVSENLSEHHLVSSSAYILFYERA